MVCKPHWANPELKKDNDRWEEFSEAWDNIYDPEIEEVRNQFKCKCEDEPVFDESGELKFEWPDELNDFDLILTTQPKPTDCFSPESLTHMFFRKPEYFVKNRLNGFETADDKDILKLLNKKSLDDFQKQAKTNCSENEVAEFIEILQKT